MGVRRDIREGGVLSADDEATPRELLLEVRDLHVRYAGAVQALPGVSLDAPEGTVTAVLGNNGAGKTTLLRAISGTLRPQQGTITFAGRNLAGKSRLREPHWAGRERLVG